MRDGSYPGASLCEVRTEPIGQRQGRCFDEILSDHLRGRSPPQRQARSSLLSAPLAEPRCQRRLRAREGSLAMRGDPCAQPVGLVGRSAAPRLAIAGHRRRGAPGSTPLREPRAWRWREGART